MATKLLMSHRRVANYVRALRALPMLPNLRYALSDFEIAEHNAIVEVYNAAQVIF